jgi:hypothetical protein
VRQLLFERLKLCLDRLQLLQLLRRRLPLDLRPPAQLLYAREQRAALFIRREQRVELLGHPLARERRPPGVRIGAR